MICEVGTDTWNKQCHLEFRGVEERGNKSCNLSENVCKLGPSDSIYIVWYCCYNVLHGILYVHSWMFDVTCIENPTLGNGCLESVVFNESAIGELNSEWD